MTRRQFIVTASAFPALAGLSRTCMANSGQRTPFEALRSFIAPGNDEFPDEALADSIRQALELAFASGQLPTAQTAEGFSPCPRLHKHVAADISTAVYDEHDLDVGGGWKRWIASLGEVRRVQFFVLPNQTIRYEVASRTRNGLAYRVGFWKLLWKEGKVQALHPVSEELTVAAEPWFHDVTGHVFSNLPAFDAQLSRGVPYWRARLDPATGIDIYGSNGMAVGDIDGDGIDEIYVCQPGGLPNKLFKFDLNHKLVDITEAWGVDLLDDTSCALFLDLRNSGKQDLIVLRSSGPILFVHEGERYRVRLDAFAFDTIPKGGFTGMAAADFDRDGKLDVYLCCYVYFQSEAQYTYASPYHDARNGPPNFLFRNELAADGSGVFRDCTRQTGLDQNNDRFSFAPAWCDYNDDGWPDLYVANDFGRKNLYRNHEGKFKDVASEANAEDIGPGMSAAWFDFDGDGKADLYVANMWTAAGQRVANDAKFSPAQTEQEAYKSHTMGNSLLKNLGDGTFKDVTTEQHAAFGRWAWAAGGHDFDNDGVPEILVACGMLSNTSKTDLESFFWREVVSKSPTTHAPSAAYENGWNAINQFIREDYSWSGHEPNVVHARRADRYFDFSGVSGLDFAEDSRAFCATDFDGDGRPDILLKSRMGPQVRILQNNCAGTHQAIAFELRGTRSNRDAIGAKVQVNHQTKWLDAGSGFLSQHSKRLTFGLGDATAVSQVRIVWPSGLVQTFSGLRPGYCHTIVEGQSTAESRAFRPHVNLPSPPVAAQNQMALHDTWFVEPVPLPEKQPAGLFVIRERTEEYAIFRRYLFDWRAPLEPPLALLLDEAGEAVKVYATIPDTKQVAADMRELAGAGRNRGLLFSGAYIKPPRRDYFKFGAAYLWAGYPKLALPYLEKVLRQTPENERVLVLVGQVHLQLEQPEQAETYFSAALKANSSSASALIGLGDITTNKQQPERASDFYGRALAADPTSPEAANALGLSLAKQGQLDKARAYFERAIASRRNYTDAINNLAVLFSQQGKVQDAIAAWRYGIQVAPEDAILYLNLGRTYVQLGERDKARVLMQQLLDRKPDDMTARHALEQLEGR